MKTFLTIRGNLLLINVVVVGLILWLAVSFLYIAAAQRVEAVMLQKSVSSKRLISLTSEALAHERSVFRAFVSSDDESYSSQRDFVTSIITTTDKNLDAMSAQIGNLISQDSFVSNIPATRTSVQQQLSTLAQQRIKLNAQRMRVLSASLRAQERTDGSALVALQTSLTNVQNDLVSLAKSLKYLPDFDSSSIESYYSILHEILITNVDLASKSLMLGSMSSTSESSNRIYASEAELLNENIKQRFADIVRLTQASDKSAQLSPIALSLQKYYLKNCQSLLLGQQNKPQPRASVAQCQSEWIASDAELTTVIKDLTEKTHAAIERLAIKSAERATRNLAIDAFLVFLCFAITLASVFINRRVKRLAYCDGLTQLSNRVNFETTLKNTSISGAQSHAVIFLDLDRFKAINDNYGHTTGDELLVEVSKRLKAICRPSDLLARLGGDEFAVLLHNIDSETAVVAIATRMVAEIERVITIRDLNLKVGASAGISIAPQDCSDGAELLKNADIAMYHTKSNKLGNVVRFDKSIADGYQQRLLLEQDLKKGLENDEFFLAYQPKVCTSTGSVKSVEALLRWSHPERGLISPVQFIPVAEDTGLMGSIGFWALGEACRQLAYLQESGLPNLQVAVNISPQQFGDQHFVERVCSTLDSHGLSYSSLSLEVTESIVMNDVARVIQMLRSLQELGIDIAVDDFGTGYSSLQYLQELPLNTLKIDRAFITALDDSGADRSVAHLIVQLAALFNLETVAEGVETVEQEKKIRALGVHHIQGYLYSKPVVAEELPRVIHAIGEQYRSSGWHSPNQAA